MKINSFLNLFSPKDVTFFPLLNESADSLVRTSQYLFEFYSNSDDIFKRVELGKLIKEEELKGDRIMNDIVKALNKTFITPFDREDINALTDYMDDVNDEIFRSSHKVLLYSPKCLPECTIKLTEIIMAGTIELQGAVRELEKLKKSDLRYKEHYNEIKRLEEEADEIYANGMTDLFKGDFDTVEIIKLKEIIQGLEKTVNKINNAGKVLKSIFVKYA